MVSAFGWLDTDSEQRRKMLEVVDLFKDEGTVDELGIGSIRDAFSDLLFPGTSVLHTRLRYSLFIPWLMQRAALKSTTPSDMSTEFRKSEYRLIESMLKGGEHQGVIGNTARSGLKILPSSMYWSALGVWEIRRLESTSEAFFRREYDYRQLLRQSAKTDDPEARETPPQAALDPHLPTPPPEFLKAADFSLTREEEQYLSDRIAGSTQGSIFAWLVHHQPGNSPDFVWEIDNLDQAPERLRNVVDHARRFSIVIHGAALLYNYLLAQRSEQVNQAEEYERRIDQWKRELLDPSQALVGWDLSDWQSTVEQGNRRISPLTISFVNRWIEIANRGEPIASSFDAEQLIVRRERQIKGGRARFVNQAALDRWSGGSGLGRHDFRWQIARSHLTDLYSAREAS